MLLARGESAGTNPILPATNEVAWSVISLGLRCPDFAGARALDPLGQFQSWIADRPREVPAFEEQVDGLPVLLPRICCSEAWAIAADPG